MFRKRLDPAVATGARHLYSQVVAEVAHAVSASSEYTNRADVAVSQIVDCVIRGGVEVGYDLAVLTRGAIRGVLKGGRSWHVPDELLLRFASKAALHAARGEGADTKAVLRGLHSVSRRGTSIRTNRGSRPDRAQHLARGASGGAGRPESSPDFGQLGAHSR